MNPSQRRIDDRVAQAARGGGGNGRGEPSSDAVPCPEGLDIPDVRGRVFCGDLDIRIDRDGIWYYDGSPITRKELVCLFASVLQRDARGDYWMVTPGEVGRIEVEDAPFMAVHMYVSGGGRDQTISFATNVDEVVTLGPEHPLRMITNPDTGEDIPYVRVRDGLDAKVARSVFYDLVARGVEEKIENEHIYGVWSQETFFPLGTMEDD